MRVPHDGGPCPVPPDTLVYVELEGGYSEEPGTSAASPSSAGWWAGEQIDEDNWRFRDGKSGIVAYWLA